MKIIGFYWVFLIFGKQKMKVFMKNYEGKTNNELAAERTSFSEYQTDIAENRPL